MRLGILGCVFVAGSLWGQETRAQDAPSPLLLSPRWPETQAGDASGANRLVAPTLSLLLPGAGQHVLGQRRKWLYLAAEAGAWVFYVERRRAGADYRERYRDYAWENGRVQTGARVDGTFGYYETLTQWTRSGAFDADANTAGVQPELDAETYNGSQWWLANAIFVPVDETDPAYQAALSFYQARAYGPAMLWDWTATPGAQEEFSELVDTSDSRFQQSTTVLGVVLANHLLSGIDAYISSTTGLAARLRVVPDHVPGRDWAAVLSIPLPR